MPIELTEVTSGYNLSVINDNFQTIEETWDEKLDRLESAQGNSMSQDIDMNNYNILNVGAITRADSVVEEAPEDGLVYGRQDAAWVEVQSGGEVEEAPIDGSQYARQDGAWSVVTGGGSGGGAYDVLEKGVYIDYANKVEDALEGFTEVTVSSHDNTFNRTGLVVAGERKNGSSGRFFNGGVASNTLPYTEDFSNAAWTTGAGISRVVSGTQTSPENTGTGFATELTVTDNASSMYIEQVIGVGGFSNISLMVKEGTSQEVELLLEDDFDQSTVGGVFNLDTKVFTYTGTNIFNTATASYEELSDGWLYVQLHMSSSSGGGPLKIGFPSTASNGDSIFIWAANYIDSAVPKTYISMTNEGFLRTSLGPDVVEAKGNMPIAGKPFSVLMDIDIENPTETNFNRRPLIGVDANSGLFGIDVAGNTLQVMTDRFVGFDTGVAPSGKARVVWRYNGDTTHDVFLDGTNIGSFDDPTLEITEWGDNLFIGGKRSVVTYTGDISDTLGLQGYLRRVYIENQALTNSEISALGGYEV